MPIPSSGSLSMSAIKAEAYLGETTVPTLISLNSSIVRSLAKITTNNSKISFSDFYGKSKYNFQSGDFSAGPLVATADPNILTTPGWIVYNSGVRLNGGSTVAGHSTPTDNIPPPGRSSAVDQFSYGGPFYESQLTTDLPPGLSFPSKSLRFRNGGTVEPYGITHGPYAVSSDPVALEVNDEVSFYWKAAGSQDAYDIYAYLVNINSGATIELLNESGEDASASTGWAKVTKTITDGLQSPNKNNPDYKFVFISGSWDATGGQATGADLSITMINVKKWFQP